VCDNGGGGGIFQKVKSRVCCKQDRNTETTNLCFFGGTSGILETQEVFPQAYTNKFNTKLISTPPLTSLSPAFSLYKYMYQRLGLRAVFVCVRVCFERALKKIGLFLRRPEGSLTLNRKCKEGNSDLQLLSKELDSGD